MAVVQVVLVCMELVVLVYSHLYPEHQHIIQVAVAVVQLEELVVPVAVVIVVGWINAGRLILTWPAVVAPLLLVPRVWHNRFLDASPLLWQLNEGQTSRFGLDYLPGNVTGAWMFFFNLRPALANSWFLSVLGFVGLAWFLGVAWRWARRPRGHSQRRPMCRRALGRWRSARRGCPGTGRTWRTMHSAVPWRPRW